VLLFTPDMQELFEWFYATHELTPTGGTVTWHRIALPGPGSIREQDAKLLEELDYLRDVLNGTLLKRRQHTPRKGTNARVTHG
jgi:hypothetical protein